MYFRCRYIPMKRVECVCRMFTEEHRPQTECTDTEEYNNKTADFSPLNSLNINLFSTCYRLQSTIFRNKLNGNELFSNYFFLEMLQLHSDSLTLTVIFLFCVNIGMSGNCLFYKFTTIVCRNMFRFHYEIN